MKKPDAIGGYALIRAVGAEPTRLLDACIDAELDFWGAYPEDDFSIVLGAKLKDAEKILALADKCSCELEIFERHSAALLAKRLKNRFVLWIFPLALAVMLISASLFIWRIEVVGNETVSETEILNALSDSGVYIGSYWPSFSSDSIRSRVLVEIPKLKWISVSTFGSRAHVEARERIKIPKLIDEHKGVKIIAEHSGIIEEINVLRGFGKFEKGQTVAKGDTLIDGAVPSTFRETRILHALGEVRAKTWYELCAILPMEYEKKEYTGDTKRRLALIVGDNRINFYRNSGILDSKCDNIISEHTFGVKGLFELPITFVCERSEAFELLPISRTEAEAKEILEARLNAELVHRIGKDGEIKSSEFTFCVSDGYAICTLRAECRQNIAKEKDMTEDEISAAKAAGKEKNTE
ncbi:MAG: sporulation protein YqfD [Oscillospiraceae bacterium]